MYKREFSGPLGSLETFLIIYKTHHAYPFQGSRTHWGHMYLPPPPPLLIRIFGVYKPVFG